MNRTDKARLDWIRLKNGDDSCRVLVLGAAKGGKSQVLEVQVRIDEPEDGQHQGRKRD